MKRTTIATAAPARARALTMMPEVALTEAALPAPVETRQVLFQNSDYYVATPVYLRDDLVPGQSIPGPCICEQMDTTLVVPKGWVIHVDGYRNLKIHDEEAK